MWFIFSCLLLSASVFLHSESFFSWQSKKYIWNLGIALSCDVKPEGNPFEAEPSTYIYPDRLRDGDIVWIQAHRLPVFVREILPEIKHRIILVVNDGDEAFPSEVLNLEEEEDLIRNENIIHVFAQNCNYQGPFRSKVSHLPIGIDYHTVTSQPLAFQETFQSVQGQEDTLKEILSTLAPTNERKKGAFVDFHLNNSNYHGRNGETRLAIWDRLKNKLELHEIIHFARERMSRRELWRMKGEYAFSISPHGNGLDCHRTWEDLMLGCIVIVKTSELDPLYEGLPVVIVNSWDEIHPENLDKWLDLYGDAFTNPEYRKKLTHRYWMDKILSYKY